VLVAIYREQRTARPRVRHRVEIDVILVQQLQAELARPGFDPHAVEVETHGDHLAKGLGP
jgi:hypothetical protein